MILLFLVRPMVDMMQKSSTQEISIQSTGQERNFLWMKACVLLRVQSQFQVL